MDNHPSGAALRTIHTLFNAGTLVGLTDGQLLERFLNPDSEGAEMAFAGLVERHGPMVLRVGRAILRDAHEAEDAFQATFLILALKARTIRGRDSLTSWLYSVAYNVAASARSSAARRRSHEQDAGRSRMPFYTEEARDDLGPVIHEELERIPERYRAVLVLCCLEGLTQHQAAQRLGWPIGTVQSRLARGRARLRARLERRGVAPSSAVLASSEAARLVVPSTLASATVRLATTIGAARALAIGGGPVAIIRLAKEVARGMVVNQLVKTGVATLLAAVVIATSAAVYAFQAARPAPVAAPEPEETKREEPSDLKSPDGLLNVAGVVRMRDGSPVVGATVRTITGSDEPSVVVRTDEAGRFRFQAVLGNGCNLHASSADGSYQTILRFQSDDTRTALRKPVELTLLPALHHGVAVVSDGRPVTGAIVVGQGTGFQVEGVTDRDGRLRLMLPAKGRLNDLVAWHPTLGVGGTRDLEDRPREATTELSLLAPASCTIRVVDVDGKPIGGLELGVHLRTEDSAWISAAWIPATHVRTNADGAAIVPWAPRDNLQYVDVKLLSSDWKVDETDVKRIKSGAVTVHARRETIVPGRLIVPEGADPEGILVSGFGFGPSNQGDIPYARARRDGSFRLRVPSQHAYVLGIDDHRWASDLWTGVILGKDPSRPAEIAIKVYPATPLTVRVARGKSHEPVAGAWVDLSSRGSVEWIDGAGKSQSGLSGVRRWLWTDADGLARAGVGRGEHTLRLSLGDWSEKRTVNVTSEKPVEFVFHRDWTGKKRVTGRLLLDGAPYQPSPALVARAWSVRTPSFSEFSRTFEPIVHPDGTFEVAFDAESASLLVLDRDRGRSGFAERVRGDGAVDVNMEATATYGGILLDEDGWPIAGRTLEFYVKASDSKLVAAQQTDQAGRFRFTGVPANVPLQMGIRDEGDAPEYRLWDDRLFNPGEVRQDDQVKARRVVPAASKPRPAVPLASRVEDLCRNVRPSRMRALVALLGDDSGDTGRTIDQLFAAEDEGDRAVLSYLTLRVDPAQLKREAAAVAGYGWPGPGPGEVVLVALDGARKTIATRRIATKPVAVAVGAGVEFLRQHRPPSQDAMKLLAEARNEARRSGRRVWVVRGGPRCAPCFRLARWIDDHHEILEKDYVIVKLMDGIDERVTEALAGLPIEVRDGVPWFAITEPDGTVLAISRGPRGNIGFPISLEEVRHFHRMLDRTVRKLTPNEVDRLIKSLASGT